MSQRPSATIIAFPRPAPVREEDPHARLARALAALDRALAEQRAAVGDWRSALATLRGSVGGLAHSLGGYQVRLGELAGAVRGVNQQARALERWADGVLTGHPVP